VFTPVDGLQERLGSPPPSKTPLCPFASSIASIAIAITITIDTARIIGRGGKRGSRQDVVCEFDDARAECSSCVAAAGVGRSAQVRGVFFAYDGVVRKGVREDGVDDRLRGIIGHC
jgi:hypothetical protein